jgi:spore coat polysaccharide biosynthesis predicted glycosyltransferase SpsG
VNTGGSTIAIRADGGGSIGLGHVMRCGALARAFTDRGVQVIWVTRTPDAAPASLPESVDIAALQSDPDEATLLRNILRQSGTRLLVGDWKFTDTELVARLRELMPVALIGGFTGDAVGDLHIRQSFLPQAPQGGRTELSGADWLLLDQRYAGLPPRTVSGPARRVLVSLGGTQSALIDQIEAALRSQRELDGATFDWRLPAGATATRSLPSLFDSLIAADIAILAGGTTLHEAAAAGLPAICVPIVDNQYDRARQYQSCGLGVMIDPKSKCFERRLVESLAALLSAPERRQRMARRAQSRVDGRGAGRLADHLISQFLRDGKESQ